MLAAIAVSFYYEILAHPVLALRAISIGWTPWFILQIWFGPTLVIPFAKQFLPPSPINPLVLIWWTVWLLSARAAGGWIVARLDRPHATAMSLAVAASVFIYGLRFLPWVWFHFANTLTNTRFLPYLVTDIASMTLPVLAALFGGLWGAPPESESRRQEAHSTP